MILDKIAHYPVSLTAPIRTILESARQGKIVAPPSGRLLSGFPETIRLERKDIPEQGTWINAAISPCIFIALTIKDSQGEIENVRAGHFSTNFSNHEIDTFLTHDRSNDLSSVWLAGLSQKRGHESLKTTVEKLVARINASGLPLSLEWTSPERPEVRDSRNQKIISDLGFGLLDNQDGPQNIRRYVSLGITRSWALLTSTLIGQIDEEKASPLNISILTSDCGRLSQQFNSI
jgi:hypothetical protein